MLVKELFLKGITPISYFLKYPQISLCSIWSLIVIFLGSVALAISAKVKIPFYPVPMTMQTFVVLFVGISFGYKIGLATICLYLIEGLAGLPVFSN